MTGAIANRNPLLLDTCAIIFLAERLPMARSALDRMTAAGVGGLLVSPVSAWEIGLFARPHRKKAGPDFQPDPLIWFERVVDSRGFRLADFTPSIAVAASFLPGKLHDDPADRLLIATARHLRVPIVTRDRRIHAYGRAGHVEVIAC